MESSDHASGSFPSGVLTQEQVKEAYEKDLQRLGQKVYDPAVLPVSFDDIIAQWLTGTLCRDHRGAEVVDYRTEPVEQGTSNRVRLRVVYNAAGGKAGLPTRLFCKASQGLSNRITLGLSGAAAATRFWARRRSNRTRALPLVKPRQASPSGAIPYIKPSLRYLWVSLTAVSGSFVSAHAVLRPMIRRGAGTPRGVGR